MFCDNVNDNNRGSAIELETATWNISSNHNWIEEKRRTRIKRRSEISEVRKFTWTVFAD